MAYVIERNSQFYVVDYGGVDPHTNKERRRWHPAGRSRADAEAIAARLTATRNAARERTTSALTVGEYLVEQWMPRRYRELRPSTAKRYEWIVHHYLMPTIGLHRLTALRAEHLNRLYGDLLDHGGTDGGPLSAKTVYDAHAVISSALKNAVDRHLVDHNVARDANPPRNSKRSRPAPEVWTAGQLTEFLAHTAHLRLYPALHLTATTGMRRGEVVGLRWSDWNPHTHQLSIARSRQAIPGGTIEVPTKTAASRRSIDLDERTEQILARWRRRQIRDGHPTGHNDPIFTNPGGDPLNPESLTQLFDRNESPWDRWRLLTLGTRMEPCRKSRCRHHPRIDAEHRTHTSERRIPDPLWNAVQPRHEATHNISNKATRRRGVLPFIRTRRGTCRRSRFARRVLSAHNNVAMTPRPAHIKQGGCVHGSGEGTAPLRMPTPATRVARPSSRGSVTGP